MRESAKKSDPSTANTNRTARSMRQTPVATGDIARRAYELFLARGYQHGHDVEDWLRAERELTEATRPRRKH